MITRDPLKIPCLTNEYWETLPAVGPKSLASTLKLVKAHPFKPQLPVVSPLPAEERLAAEEQNVLASLEYSRKHLALQ
jgi:hypothetical protein